MTPRISAIVCTYNRPAMLRRTLDSLLGQSLPEDQYEVIVVDNASTDSTKDVVEEYVRRSDNIRHVHEPEQGLSQARNRGIEEARAEIIAFIDDDAVAGKSWLKTAVKCFDEVQPKPVAVGGPILPLYDAVKPEWFKDEYEAITWGEEPRFLRPGEAFWGSNMIFDKKALEVFGHFDINLGLKKDTLFLGEDIEIFKRIWRLDPDVKIYCSPALIVYHSGPDYKMTVRYRLKRSFVKIAAYKIPLGCGLAILRLQKHTSYQSWMCEEFDSVALYLGELTRLLGLDIQLKARF
jgi:glycosyltransferase involved in cell wall biosynthesis